MQDIFLLVRPEDDYTPLTDKFPRIKLIHTEDRVLTEEVMSSIVKKTLRSHFYVITNCEIDIGDYQFNYTSEKWDDKYTHIWDNDSTVRFFCKSSVKKNMKMFCQEYLTKGKARLKDAGPKFYTRKLPDVFVMVSKDEYDYYVADDRYKPVITDTLDYNTLYEMSAASEYRCFYVITSMYNKILDPLEFVPANWDLEYMHVWNNDYTIRLYSKEHVSLNPEKYTDTMLRKGLIDIKHIKVDHKMHELSEMDIVFISYDEPYADENYSKLTAKFPRAKRVHGVKGIFEAHKAAARVANTPMFYVVDADAIIKPGFRFNYVPNKSDRSYVHLWNSVNPVNGLKYGYGGVKLFPTRVIRELKEWSLDFTLTSTNGLKLIDIVSNTTAFNTSPFNTWRSAFRECVKLASKVDPKIIDHDTEDRLYGWCKEGHDAEFAEYALQGARAGREYGSKHKHDKAKLDRINDFEWLQEQFDLTLAL